MRLFPQPGPKARMNAWVFLMVAITQALLAVDFFDQGDTVWAFTSVGVALGSVAFIAAIVTRERHR